MLNAIYLPHPVDLLILSIFNYICQSQIINNANSDFCKLICFFRMVPAEMQHTHPCKCQNVTDRRESRGVCSPVHFLISAQTLHESIGSFVFRQTRDQRVTRSSASSLSLKILSRF